MKKVSHATTLKNIFNYKYQGRFPIDFEECKKSNVLVSGTNQQGKSLCSMLISDILMRNYPDNWQIIVFDNVGHWKQKSSIPVYYTVSENTMKYVLPKSSIIFDISLLLPAYQREFVENVLHETWKTRIQQKSEKWLMLVFEEFQLYAKNVRGNVSQNILRIMSVGANHGIRCLGITPDMSLIDCAFIRLTNQRYHFRLGNEPNAKRRFNSYYGKDYTTVARELDVGFCLYYLNEKLKVWKIPKFHQDIRPRQWQEPKPKKKGLLARIFGTSEEIDVDSDGVIMEGEDLLEEMFEDD